MVILLEKFILFQIKDTFSKRILFPFLGAFGRNNSVGFSFKTRYAVYKVAPTIHRQEITKGITTTTHSNDNTIVGTSNKIVYIS